MNIYEILIALDELPDGLVETIELYEMMVVAPTEALANEWITAQYGPRFRICREIGTADMVMVQTGHNQVLKFTHPAPVIH